LIYVNQGCPKLKLSYWVRPTRWSADPQPAKPVLQFEKNGFVLALIEGFAAPVLGCGRRLPRAFGGQK
jgi:starvation-inducible outer membrane lipoprotein